VGGDNIEMSMLANTETRCPICHGRCYADINLDTRTQAVGCTDCGYTANSETVKGVKTLKRKLAKDLLQFVKWSKPYDSIGLRMDRSILWWPSEKIEPEYAIRPVVLQGRLLWRRREEAVTGWVKSICADYPTFHEADRTTPTANRARGIMQSLSSNKPKFTLLYSGQVASSRTPFSRHGSSLMNLRGEMK